MLTIPASTEKNLTERKITDDFIIAFLRVIQAI